VDIVYLNSSKAFDTVSCKILLEKLLKCGLHKHKLGWTENWLNHQAQRVAISCMKSIAGGQKLVVYTRGKCWV